MDQPQTSCPESPHSPCNGILSLSLSLFHIDSWTGLPNTQGTRGIGLCQSTCVGCQRGIRWDQPQHRCHFATNSFVLDQVTFLPCGTTYHLGCIRVGEPFRSRLPAGRGLTYPRLAIVSTFICESCTVRAQIKPTRGPRGPIGITNPFYGNCTGLRLPTG
jgi:hypothetical protein